MIRVHTHHGDHTVTALATHDPDDDTTDIALEVAAAVHAELDPDGPTVRFDAAAAWGEPEPDGGDAPHDEQALRAAQDAYEQHVLGGGQ